MNIATSLRLGYQTQLSLPLGSRGDRLLAPVAPAQPLSSETLAGELRQRLGVPVRIDIHDNRSTMVSYRRNGEGFVVRVHRMFMPPPSDFAATLAAFLAERGRQRAEAGRWLDRYIRDHRDAIRPPPTPAAPSSRGQTRDLQPIFDSLNARYFGGAIDAAIGWGRATSKRRRRSIKMGVYFHDHRQIRIHPALDRPDVPDYLVEFVVYHEMCHQVCPPEPGAGSRKRIHTRAFRERERLHPERERALSWEKRHLKLLLRATTAGDRAIKDYS